MRKNYEIAEKIISIDSLHEEVHRLCNDYLSDSAEADFSVCVTQADIDYEREKSRQEDIAEGIEIRQFSDSYLESLAVYRQIAEKMPEYDTFLFHGSCIAVENEAYLFTARSGIGKSTHARLWREMLGDKAIMVNDDKPLIRVAQDGAIVYGTPWDGKHRLGNNIRVPLKAICLLERANKNRIVPVRYHEVYAMLLQQTYRPYDEKAMKKTLELLDRLSSLVSFWKLECNQDIEAAEIAYKAMRGERDETE